MPAQIILVLNSGSSSIKFSLWQASQTERAKLLEGQADGIGQNTAHFSANSWLNNADGAPLIDERPALPDNAAGFAVIEDTLRRPEIPQPTAIGHRMVCGGPTVIENQRITPALLDEMERYINFAPLHAPAALFLMRHATALYPGIANFVCLDSWFHRDLPQVTRNLPIPAQYTQLGLRRFGAHGLSYESILAHLAPNIPSRLIVAHLGNGSSICAIRDGKSIDTSMGLTPTGGLISGSRTGDLDPGIVLFLLRHLTKSEPDTARAANALEDILNKQSGLRGVSKLSNDMRTLRAAIVEGNAAARLAVDEFVYLLRKFVGAYTAVLGGLDMLVFTGGIGEHDAATRAEVCDGLDHLGLVLNPSHNEQAKGPATISADSSRVTIRVIPAAEDQTIVHHVCQMVR